MNKKDYVIVSFFVLIFAVVLYERKLKHVFSSSGSASVSTTTSSSSSISSTSEAGQLNNSFSEIVEALTGTSVNKEKGIPPQGLNTKSFYDEKGKFKSYYEGKLPDEFLTKIEHFTDPYKMQDDIYYKKSKMFWHQDAEREEFKRFHDWRGKDKKKWNELLDNHAKAQHEADEKNRETWKQLKRDYYQYDSELR